MIFFVKIFLPLQRLLDYTHAIDFLGPLALRLYLVPIFWMAGFNKFQGFDGTVAWFGSMGMPMPELLAALATGSELLGAILLTIGLAVRWISIPLMVTMAVAATVHWQHGWLAIAEGSGIFSTERTIGAIERLNVAKGILKEQGNYSWLTQDGGLVILNNGIEFAATYFIMLLVLFFIGGGRYFSVDYWIRKHFMPEASN
ncbi:putative oxidoreductase CatD [bacterium BMS3Bbin11]|nr:putative oxidoreductase CatD [bacterium BMS3Abin11]GBE45889.1 putative oxidoreductase CatD [bacterium BMS3Bbin11]GMT39733.1 MAG: DoxD-like inner membrane protein [bacterium]HDH17095.1 DoxX family protein [Gammaproteobacteria bacterium]